MKKDTNNLNLKKDTNNNAAFDFFMVRLISMNQFYIQKLPPTRTKPRMVKNKTVLEKKVQTMLSNSLASILRDGNSCGIVVSIPGLNLIVHDMISVDGVQ